MILGPHPWEITDTVYCFYLLPRRKKKLLHGDVTESLAPTINHLTFMHSFIHLFNSYWVSPMCQVLCHVLIQKTYNINPSGDYNLLGKETVNNIQINICNGEWGRWRKLLKN